MVQSKKILQFDFIEHYFLNKIDTLSSFYTDRIREACLVQQIHGNKILVVADRGKTSGYDGMVTSENIWLGIRTADCLPLFFVDPKKKIVVAIHAGWKGLSLDIIKIGIDIMKKKGSSLSHIIAAIGPHIGICCYAVGRERVEYFAKKMCEEKEKIARFQLGQWYLDLSVIAQLQMMREGIDKEHIDHLGLCTVCNLVYSSSRREGENCQRMMNLIRIIK